MGIALNFGKKMFLFGLNWFLFIGVNKVFGVGALSGVKIVRNLREAIVKFACKRFVVSKIDEESFEGVGNYFLAVGDMVIGKFEAGEITIYDGKLPNIRYKIKLNEEVCKLEYRGKAVFFDKSDSKFFVRAEKKITENLVLVGQRLRCEVRGQKLSIRDKNLIEIIRITPWSCSFDVKFVKNNKINLGCVERWIKNVIVKNLGEMSLKEYRSGFYILQFGNFDMVYSPLRDVLYVYYDFNGLKLSIDDEGNFKLVYKDMIDISGKVKMERIKRAIGNVLKKIVYGRVVEQG